MPTSPTHDEMVANLLLTYREAEPDVPGKDWYKETRSQARSMARECGVTLATAAGVIAALSPQVHWVRNKRLAQQTLVWGSPVEGCLGLSRERAERIGRGARPLSVLSGEKTRAFYRAIMGDEDAAVIDVWMLHAMGWPGKSVSPAQYKRCEDALREAAHQAGLTTTQFQAVVWVQVRGKED